MVYLPILDHLRHYGYIFASFRISGTHFIVLLHNNLVDVWECTSVWVCELCFAFDDCCVVGWMILGSHNVILLFMEMSMDARCYWLARAHTFQMTSEYLPSLIRPLSPIPAGRARTAPVRWQTRTVIDRVAHFYRRCFPENNDGCRNPQRPDIRAHPLPCTRGTPCLPVNGNRERKESVKIVIKEVHRSGRMYIFIINRLSSLTS